MKFKVDNTTNLFKLIDGEWIIGEIEKINYDDCFISIKQALGINYSVRSDGVPIIYFYKYCLYNNSYTIDIKMEHLMNYVSDPLKFIVKQYKIAIEKYKKVDKENEKNFDIDDNFSNNIIKFNGKNKDLH